MTKKEFIDFVNSLSCDDGVSVPVVLSYSKRRDRTKAACDGNILGDFSEFDVK